MNLRKILFCIQYIFLLIRVKSSNAGYVELTFKENNDLLKISIIHYGLSIYYYKNGRIHRNNGPAIILKKPNEKHRWWLDPIRKNCGFPIEFESNEYYAWYINNNDISNDVNDWMKNNNIKYPFSKNELLLFKLTFL